MFEMKIFAILLTIFLTALGGGGDDGGRKVPPKPTTPCPAGKHYLFNRKTFAWECVDDTDLPDVDDDDDVDVIQCPPGMHSDEDGECVPDTPTCPPGQVWNPATQSCQPGGIKPADDDDDDVPDAPFDPDFPQIIKPYPAPGNFYQVVTGDQMLGVEGTGSVTWRALVEAGIRAAMKHGGLSNAGGMASPAAQWAKTLANEAALRMQYKDMTLCGGWTDRTNATFGWCDADCVANNAGPGQNSPGPHGRAIRFLPQHPDNSARLAAHLQPIRNMRMLTAASEGKGNGFGAVAALRKKHELVWLPDLDLEALWNDRQLKTSAKWPDGSSKALPPPWVQQLGLDDRSGSNLGVVSGCGVGAWGG